MARLFIFLQRMTCACFAGHRWQYEALKRANGLNRKIVIMSVLGITCFLQVDGSPRVITLQGPPAKTIAVSEPPVFRLDQFGYISQGAKNVIFEWPASIWKEDIDGQRDSFFVYRVYPVLSGSTGAGKSMAKVLTGAMPQPVMITQWFKDRRYYVLDVSSLQSPGKYQVVVKIGPKSFSSAVFRVLDKAAFVHKGIGALLNYFSRQRANTAIEWAADAHLKLKGSTRRVDLRGGWCDASGDVSKYFSHLAYTNFMSPQQIPLVTWSLVQATEKLAPSLKQWYLLDSVQSESLWGADYLLRSLSDSDFFYMTVFSYFKKDPAFREIVGLEANSVTTTDYRCAFREGAGVAIAALARISCWKLNGHFTATNYLNGAKRAYQHLLSFNNRYDDDGVPNIIDDYCALMAATELWKATGDKFYRHEARHWAGRLCARYMPDGYLRADGPYQGVNTMTQTQTRVRILNATPRPFWHASDAGMPVVSLIRYLDMEKESNYRNKAINIIRDVLSHQLAISNAVVNPFDYPRQQFLYKGKLETGFFIPHENESGWWWQGENARLASLATAALSGGVLLEPQGGQAEAQIIQIAGLRGRLKSAALHHLSWITGCNPYGICFLYGFGYKNVPYMHSNYGHGSETGGISNGITGLNCDGTGIAFRTEDQGNEWRWTEQWLPHAAWYLQALTALGSH